jgi:hypothetical protein
MGWVEVVIGGDGWESGIFVRAVGMADLRVEDLVSSRPQPPDNTKENSRRCLCEEDHRENAQGSNTYRLRMGVVERVRCRGVSKSRRFRITLERRRTRLDWDSASPDFVRVP